MGVDDWFMAFRFVTISEVATFISVSVTAEAAVQNRKIFLTGMCVHGDETTALGTEQ